MSPIENGERIKIHERLATLETNVNTILKNHLPHIQGSIKNLNNKIWAIIMLLIGNLVGLVTTLIILLIK